MPSFQRRLDLLDYIPRYPRKITTRGLLNLLEQMGHNSLNIRTIQRDLESIEKMGLFGLEVDKRSKPFGWSINASWKKLNISLMDANTALAFSTLEQLGDSLLPESTLRELSAYFGKAKSILESQQLPLISHWKKSVALVSDSHPVLLPTVDNELLKTIKSALYNKKQITADVKRYLKPINNPTWLNYTRINPLALIFKDFAPVLICCFGGFHQKSYQIPLSFLRNVAIEESDAITPFGFELPKVANANYGRTTSGKVINLRLKTRKNCLFLLLDGKLADDQEVVECKDSDYVIVTVTTNDTVKLRSFICSLGSSVEVLAPSNLRDHFKKIAEELFTKYKEP